MNMKVAPLMAPLHGGSLLSSVIRPRLRVAALRIAILTCFGLFAITGAALASSSSPSSSPVGQAGDFSAYVAAPGDDSGSGPSLSLSDGTSTFTLSAGSWKGLSHLDPYRSG
jgi:hypothetical protein